MRFQDLSSVSLTELTRAFNEAFSDYFIKLQLNEEALATKLRSENVDLHCSVGAFDGEQLIGFILHGVGTRGTERVVYNAGTGVVPAYRGQGLTRQLYQSVLPVLAKEGMLQHQLEVIEQNTPAISVYEKVGFTRARTLGCFKGTLQGETDPQLTFEEVATPDFEAYRRFWNFTPTWQNDTPSVQRALDAHRIIEVKKDGELVAYAVYTPANGRVKQYGVHPDHRRKGYGRQLFRYLCRTSSTKEAILINVDESDTASIGFFKALGFQRFLGQWEMTYTAER